MQRVSRLAIIPAAIILAATSVAPAAAVDPPPPEASIQVQVDVGGYAVPDGMGGTVGIWCNTWGDEPIEFYLESTASPLVSDLFPVEPGSECDVVSFWGWETDLGFWMDWQDTPSGSFSVPAGDPVVVTISAERAYNGNEPWPDGSWWVGLDAFTVDRVFINRYGGVTAEGTILCSSLADFYGYEGYGEPPYLGVNWQATQYVGRKTAIHGNYWSDIANACFDLEHPDTPQPWRSMHPGVAEAVTAWVYGEDGKFASGTIRIDAVVEDESVFVLQWWDPSGESATYDPARCGLSENDEFFDANADGFCAIDLFVGQRTTANLKTIRVR